MKNKTDDWYQDCLIDVEKRVRENETQDFVYNDVKKGRGNIQNNKDVQSDILLCPTI